MGTVKFYRDEPIFGLDIGHSNIKAMQIGKEKGKPPVIKGFGMSSFDPGAIQNGIIMDPETVANAMHQLFEQNLTGAIDTRRVACTLPTTYTFSRPMQLPLTGREDLKEAVRLEAEQYIPIPIDNLYIDYEISHQDDKNTELLLVAASKKIVDSYLELLQSLDLEPVAFEPSISASARLLKLAGDNSPEPSILVDIGSVATDIAIFDRTLLVSSTVNGGGDTFASLISKSMRMSMEQAVKLKNEVGIAFSDKQQRIIDAIKPQVDTLIREIQKSIRFYSERTDKSGKKISRVITVGGGAVMPGFNQYLSKQLRLPTNNLEPWQEISFGGLAMPEEPDRSMYITAAGEAILDPQEVAS